MWPVERNRAVISDGNAKKYFKSVPRCVAASSAWPFLSQLIRANSLNRSRAGDASIALQGALNGAKTRQTYNAVLLTQNRFYPPPRLAYLGVIEISFQRPARQQLSHSLPRYFFIAVGLNVCPGQQLRILPV